MTWKILATGSYLPERIVSNDDLSKIISTTNEWIVSKTGISERRYAAPGEGATSMAKEASLRALHKANLKSSDIDAIIFATATPDYHAPGCAILLQKELACREIACFDVRNTSPGFLYALDLADGLISSRRYKTILVVGSEVHSRMLDFSDEGRLMSVIFGDGAGCAILQVEASAGVAYDSVLKANGTYFDKLWCKDKHPQMDGRLVFESAVREMTLAAKELLLRNKIGIGDVDWFVSHQANLRIIEAVGANLNVPFEKCPTVIQKYGNLSSASIPVVLDEALSQGHIKRGERILMTSFGSGFCWGAGMMIY